VVTAINCIYTDANGIPITADFSPADPNGTPTANILWNVFGDPNLTAGNIGCMVPEAVIDPNDPYAKLDNGNVSQIIGSPINLGYLEAEYLDLRANMFWDTRIGMFSFTPNVSIVTKYDYPRQGIASADVLCAPSGDPTTTADDVCNGLGREAEFSTTSVQAMPRWQGTFAGALRFGNHNVRLTAFYTDGVNVPIGDLTANERATFTRNEGLWRMDLNWFWRFNAASSLNMSVRNILAEEADPTTSGNGSFFNQNLRTYSIQFTQSFGT